MAQEALFQYTYVKAGIVENVVLRPTDDLDDVEFPGMEDRLVEF
ncbi:MULTISPECIES: hypothetical protein [unclassified Halorubrum]|nr:MULTISPECIES: hypothetical protein [unclassified Halorubrum]